MDTKRTVARLVRGMQFPEFLEAEMQKNQRVVEAGDIVQNAELKSAAILRKAEDEAARTRDKIATEWAAHQLRMSDVSVEVVGRVIDQRQMAEGARVILETAAAAKAVRQDFEALHPWLTELVETCVQRILGETPNSERWGGVIRQSLKTIRSRWNLQLSCHPSEFDLISDVVAKHPVLSGEGLQVKADYRLPNHKCILLHPDGAIDISVTALVTEMCKYVSRASETTPEVGETS